MSPIKVYDAFTIINSNLTLIKVLGDIVAVHYAV